MSDSFSATLRHFDLDGEQRKSLRAVGKRVVPHLEEVLTAFYGYIGTEPEVSGFFDKPGLLEHARSAQLKHWTDLLSGEFTDTYLRSAARIGAVHHRIQLPFQHYLSGYSRAVSHIQEIVINESLGMMPGKGKSQLAKNLGILSRTFALDTQMVIDGYFAAQQEELTCALNYLSDGVQSIADRDFTRTIPSPAESDFPQRYDAVRQTFNVSLKELNTIFATLKSSVTSISERVAEVTANADDLSRRTETQAATLEETAAAMDEITQSQTASTEAAQKTDSVVREARVNAEASEQVVQQAVVKMQEIATSSDQITQITNVLDDIAFQTNLLALNAGVEAARAGDAGLGFAVVASEVRNLALRATESATEIKGLIGASNEHVKSGVEFVSATGTALSEIVDNVKNASSLVGEITSAVQDQSLGFGEINSGVAELDQVTQRNAGIAEKTITSVNAAEQEIQGLEALIATFKMQAGGMPATMQAHPNRKAA